jgi:hypothetical protein
VIRSNTIAWKIGLCLALTHFVAFVVLALYIRHSVDPQAPLLWGVFAVIDFPLSLIYLLAGAFSHEFPYVAQSWFAQFLYFPYLIHGLLGTIWWYLLPRIVTPRRLGGVW